MFLPSQEKCQKGDIHGTNLKKKKNRNLPGQPEGAK